MPIVVAAYAALGKPEKIRNWLKVPVNQPNDQ
jgi:hypothetical protein